MNSGQLIVRTSSLSDLGVEEERRPMFAWAAGSRPAADLLGLVLNGEVLGRFEGVARNSALPSRSNRPY